MDSTIYSRSNAILENSFFFSEGFISVERSNLLTGVHKCFYSSPQFLRFLMIFKVIIIAINKTN